MSNTTPEKISNHSIFDGDKKQPDELKIKVDSIFDKVCRFVDKIIESTFRFTIYIVMGICAMVGSYYLGQFINNHSIGFLTIICIAILFCVAK